LTQISFPALETVENGFAIVSNPQLPNCQAKEVGDVVDANTPEGVPVAYSGNLDDGCADGP
jgi:hypothetical protein